MPSYQDESAPVQSLSGFTVLKQRVDLDLDFANRTLRGSTELTLQPLTRELRHIKLHCRQCRPVSVQAGGINAKWEHDDPYRRLRMPAESTIHQHEMLRSKIESSLGPTPEPELNITLPAKLKPQELHIDPLSALPQYATTPSLVKQESDALAVLDTPTAATAQGPQFAPFMIYIEFQVESFRDGLQWIGFDDDDNRFPHVYTKAEPAPGNSSCIFPCLDDATTRCSWEIYIKAPRTLGDAFRKSIDSQGNGLVESERNASAPKVGRYHIELSEDDAASELTILCVGDMVEDMADSDDDTRHIVSFSMVAPVTARHIGFAVGPFEAVDLGAFREAEDEEKLGQSAIKISGYCLPSRSAELRNTAMPVHLAIDHFGVNYGSFPFSAYQMLFLDELIYDTVALAGMTFCSSRLLFGPGIIEPLTRNTRKLTRAVADQWMGVNVIAKESTDAWIVAGIAGFMTDLFGKRLFGNNEYRWAQKLASEEVYNLDADRPSLHQLGTLLHIDPSIKHFLDLKSALVLFILDRRLMKASSSTGVARIINKIFLNAKTGSLVNGELSTADFQRTCEKLGHNKLDAFFKQWVFGAGCPIFEIRQRFNKKKLVVEMTITQRQMDRQTKPEFAPNNFMREMKEHVQEVWAPEVQAVFTGPMTIRIHEADGTPYEHIVEIKEQVTKLEIPYNTKYKRLKRSRRQRERAMASGANNDTTGEGGDDALLYCLGDILDSAQEIEEWNLKDWSAEDEEKMGQESYEWIRIDADFEWIGLIHLWLPVYMYVSQLQQDRDLAAQYDSVKYIESCGPHHVSLSVLLRTLMDRRYFHGIRTMAANAIATIARENMREIGQLHLEKAFADSFCFPNSIMPRPNDWSSRVDFLMQCAIPRAMARLKDADGKVPITVRRFFVDKLKFNDNSDNQYSDAHYIATLIKCLADALVVSHREEKPTYAFHFDAENDDDTPMATSNPDADFEVEAVNEIERYRRIDEWVFTYHNIYSVTALDCLQKLTQAGIVKDKAKELLIYTRRGNADDVRLEAFKCLNETGLSKRASILQYMLHEFADDSSPHFRRRLLTLLGEAFGHIALRDREVEEPVRKLEAEDGLILEQGISEETRRAAVSRKTTPDGALVALKQILGNEAAFQEGLWYAITSPLISIDEVGELTDIASLLFDATTSYIVKLRLPRPYKAARLKDATVKFWQHGAYRSAPRKPLSLQDWQALQKAKLSYNGPLATEVHTQIHLDEEKSLKSQIEALKQHAASQVSAAPESVNTSTMMPPPLAPVNTERSGIRISLGAKRKQSMGPSPQEESPKPSKLNRTQPASEGGLLRVKTNTAPSGERRASASSSVVVAHMKKTGKGTLIVRLKLSSAAAERVATILATPPTQSSSSRPTSRQKSQPRSSSQSSADYFNDPQSPSGMIFNHSPAQDAPQLNVGAFRSYGPTTVPLVASPSADIKSEQLDGLPALISTSGLIETSPRVLSPEPTPLQNGAPPVVEDGQAAASLAPPSRKITLKLGRKPSQDEATK